MKIIFATGNPGKVKEIRAVMADLGLEVQTMTEAGFHPEIVENGETFQDNALIKVNAIGVQRDAIVMSDDSGLSIDALGGEPGVHSARYLGEDTPHEIKNRAILSRMEGLYGKERSARFICNVALLFPDGQCMVVESSLEGQIALNPAGENGFGYDPIFYLPDLGKTNAELSPEEKNRISHRGKALRIAEKRIASWLRSLA